MPYSTKESGKPQAGFTLLEMIVVLLLVSLLSGLLMQGFLYMSRIYGVVARQENRVSTVQLLDGWIRNSVRGLVNGIDEGVPQARSFFAGDNEYFRGLSYSPVLGNVPGDSDVAQNIYVPYMIEYRLVREEGQTELVYGETLASQNNWQWFTLGTWQTETAEFRYRTDQRWTERFPDVGSVFGYSRKALPDGISLYIQDGPDSYEIFVAVGSDANTYRSVADPQGDLY